jgi:hypothetical protein
MVAEIDTTVAVAATTETIDAWYRGQLSALGWTFSGYTGSKADSYSLNFNRFGKRAHYAVGFSLMDSTHVAADKVIPGDTLSGVSYKLYPCFWTGHVPGFPDDGRSVC